MRYRGRVEQDIGARPGRRIYCGLPLSARLRFPGPDALRNHREHPEAVGACLKSLPTQAIRSLRWTCVVTEDQPKYCKYRTSWCLARLLFASRISETRQVLSNQMPSPMRRHLPSDDQCNQVFLCDLMRSDLRPKMKDFLSRLHLSECVYRSKCVFR